MDDALPRGQAGQHHSATSDYPPPGPDRYPDDKDPPLTTSGAISVPSRPCTPPSWVSSLAERQP